MRLRYIFFILIHSFIVTALLAGPEIYDPMEAYKKLNTLSARPKLESVTQGTITETAQYKYENNLLHRIDYFDAKRNPTGYLLYTYDKGNLTREQLFDAQGAMVEDITYEYRKEKLIRTLVHDIRGNAHVEWRYSYNKEGELVSGKRIFGKAVTETFRITKNPTGSTQSIFNARGELTSKVESVYEDGVLRYRVKTGLIGTRYAEYRYNNSKQLIEIIYHETVRGVKTLVKKHRFEYSLASNMPTKTAQSLTPALRAL